MNTEDLEPPALKKEQWRGRVDLGKGVPWCAICSNKQDLLAFVYCNYNSCAAGSMYWQVASTRDSRFIFTAAFEAEHKRIVRAEALAAAWARWVLASSNAKYLESAWGDARTTAAADAIEPRRDAARVELASAVALLKSFDVEVCDVT